jgi:hypothetical protein
MIGFVSKAYSRPLPPKGGVMFSELAPLQGGWGVYPLGDRGAIGRKVAFKTASSS